MAKFHATCIAMRLQHHELFETKVRPFTAAINLILDGDTGMIDVNDNLQCNEYFRL